MVRFPQNPPGTLLGAQGEGQSKTRRSIRLAGSLAALADEPDLAQSGGLPGVQLSSRSPSPEWSSEMPRHTDETEFRLHHLWGLPGCLGGLLESSGGPGAIGSLLGPGPTRRALVVSSSLSSASSSPLSSSSSSLFFCWALVSCLPFACLQSCLPFYCLL